jgi:hypothetical protein
VRLTTAGLHTCGSDVPSLPSRLDRNDRRRHTFGSKMNAQEDIDSASVVVKGHFNPTIFSPAWLAVEGIISKEDSAEATIEIIAPQIAVIQLPWVRCQVDDTSLQLTTADPQEFLRLRDLGVAILNVLRHTPVGAVGLNRAVHFGVSDPQRWHAIGDTLAPKEPWDGVLDVVGTGSVTVQGVRPDDYLGHVQVTVEPSMRVQPGIFVAYNDHHLLQKSERRIRSREEMVPQPKYITPDNKLIPMALDVITNNWETSMTRADLIIARVASMGGGL